MNDLLRHPEKDSATHPFVRKFHDAWASRDPRRLGELLQEDVVLIQPLVPTLRGRNASVRGLAQFLEMIPDLEISIVDSTNRGDVVFIEFDFAGTIGKRRVSWRLMDCIDLVDGLVRQRVSYFDPLPVLRAVLSQPSLWYRFISTLNERRL